MESLHPNTLFEHIDYTEYKCPLLTSGMLPSLKNLSFLAYEKCGDILDGHDFNCFSESLFLFDLFLL